MLNRRPAANASRTVAALVASLGLGAWAAAAQTDRPGIGALLDRYAAGQFDEALKPVAAASRQQARALRSVLVSTGHRWTHAQPDDLGHRILAAAGFALEFEAIRAEKGEWEPGTEFCTGRCGIEWACTILRARGEADEPERLWHRATFALAGGVRDWSFLLTPLTPPTPRTRVSGHVLHTLGRIPEDPHARLARALATASRHFIADEMDAPRADERTSQVPSLPPLRPFVAEMVASRVQTSLVYAQQQFIALLEDPVVGAEARMRLGYLLWRAGQNDQALAAEIGAADAANDANLRYLAYFIAGMTSQSGGSLPEAEALYSRALEARPRSQSATIALAALQYLRGEAGAAYDAIEALRTGPPRDDDPWRLFLYGDYPQLGARIADFRKSVLR
jgi:tetratricopeptide (TPR) repeat protein